MENKNNITKKDANVKKQVTDEELKDVNGGVKIILERMYAASETDEANQDRSY